MAKRLSASETQAGEAEFSRDPHRRFNPLKDEWVLVSPQRATRPWQGQVEAVVAPAVLAFDPGCYLCPGNTRSGGQVNPAYTGTFVFENDFAVLRPDTPAWEMADEGLLRAQSEPGRSRVVCFSPRHDLTLARMDVRDVERVVETWAGEYTELGGDPRINSVMIFENRGAMVGCSNAHPHGQIWANRSLPDETVKELSTQGAWFRSHGSTMLSDYLQLELRRRDRIVVENEAFVVVVPFWAVWPFEVLLMSRRAVSALDELTQGERAALAAILQELTIRYDNLFQTSFPYTMGFHQRPTDGQAHPEFHLHAHYYPPLLRSATVKKFMVGYELMAGPQRDITAEAAARRLREVSGKHYLSIS